MHLALIPYLALIFMQASGKRSSYKRCQTYNVGDGTFHLSCRKKGFTEIPLDPPSNIKSCSALDFYYNKIEVIRDGAFNGMDRVAEVNLDGNRIKNVAKGTFNGLYNLKYLGLRLNKIRTIANGTFSQLRRLDHIYLSHNQLEKVNRNTWIGLKSLTVLDLSDNGIKKLTDGTFSDLSKLEELYLNKNQLEFLGQKALAGLKNLRWLNLSNQRTKGKLVLTEKMFGHFIERFWKTGKKLSLFIRHTSFNCTCDMYWLVHLINRRELPGGKKFPLFPFGFEHYTGTTCGSYDIYDDLFFQSLKHKCGKAAQVVKR